MCLNYKLRKMTILIVGDPHFKPSTVMDTKKLKQQTLKLIKERNVQVLVILGDVLDRHSTIHMKQLSDAISYVKESSTLLKNNRDNPQSKFSVYILVGNHDIANNAAYLPKINSLLSLSLIDGVKLISTPYRETIYGIDTVFAPYVPNGRLVEALQTIDVDGVNNKSVLMCHQEFKGCRLSENVISETGDNVNSELLKQFGRIISGHIHHYSERNIDNTILTYLGTPYQISFGESEDRALGILNPDLTLERVRIEFIPKKTIKCHIDEVQKAIDKCLDISKGRHAKYRIIVSGNISDFESAKVSVNGKTKRLRNLKIKEIKDKIMREIIIIPNVGDELKISMDQINPVDNIDFVNELKMSLSPDLQKLLENYL